jgi:hypothetical protein
MITPFPYPVGHKVRRLTEKPKLYRGWTIYAYQTWCQQYGAAHGEWHDLALACKTGAPVIAGVGDLYKAIDQAVETGQPPAALWAS